MCGIVGFWAPGFPEGEAAATLSNMEHALAHRGPDDHGIWFDGSAGVGFGHRRLAIVDLSPEGHQPMRSASGRYTLCYNGEVFNFGALMEELRARGHSFRGHSDTEVMLAAFEEWGLEASLKRFIGMFAFALWDAQERALHLVRDRLGIKPLYYGWQNGTLLFGSELKGLRAHPHFAAPVDPSALALFLRHGYIPAPHSIYVGIHKQEPGTIVTVAAPSQPYAARTKPFWAARGIIAEGLRAPFAGSDAEAIEALDAQLRDAVRLRMIADVPLGAFLSGGVDSSTVVALMQAQSSRPVKTFSIGFTEPEYNEAPHARAVAAHLGTEHTEMIVTPAEALDVIPRLPAIYDEPFADSSQIPTFLISQLTRRHVTVSLSGDGGDELFGGYHRYARTAQIWASLQRLPGPARPLLASAFRNTPDGLLNAGLAWMRPIFRRYGRDGRPSDKLHRLADLLAIDDPQRLYADSVSNILDPERLVPGALEPITALRDPGSWLRGADYTHAMMAADLVTYLPDDILVKVDRASMAVALEARVPLLDHRVVELAWRLPLHLKVRDGQAKWLLRRVLDRYVPATLIDRPKMGFGIPVYDWLRGPLLPWAEALLDPQRLAREGYLAPGAVRVLWDEHRSGARPRGPLLWSILMFQAWLEEQGLAQPVLAA